MFCAKNWKDPCLFAYMYVSHACTCLGMKACTYAAGECILLMRMLHVCMYICVYACMYVCMYIRMYVCSVARHDL
jgi:hypothetical protein